MDSSTRSQASMASASRQCTAAGPALLQLSGPAVALSLSLGSSLPAILFHSFRLRFLLLTPGMALPALNLS